MAFDTAAKVIPGPKVGGYPFVPTVEINGVEISTEGGGYSLQEGTAHFIAPGLVLITINITLSAKGSGTGQVRLRWPTTATDGTPLPAASSIRHGAAMDHANLSALTINQVTASAVGSSRTVELIKRIAAASSVLDAADISGTFLVRAQVMVGYTP